MRYVLTFRKGRTRVEIGMYQTIRLSSCVSVQGEFVEMLSTGEIIIRDGDKTYCGVPVTQKPMGAETSQDKVTLSMAAR